MATQALTYATSYKTLASRRILVQEFGKNVGISALVGPANRIDTVPGFTAWKCLTVLAIIGAVWGILTSTKLTRGEEDAGRWEMLLAGGASRKSGARQAMLGFAAGATALFALTSIVTVAIGHSSKVGISAGGAVYFALAITSSACIFLAIGALCGEVSTSRRQAAGLASALLGASYALRMIADSGASLAWLRWATPLGWVEELQPLTNPRPLAFVPIVATTLTFGLATVVVAGRRDLGAGSLPDRSSIDRVRRLPTTPVGIGLYMSRSTLIAWSVSIVAYGLLLGSIAKSGGKIITGSRSLRLAFARLGVSGAEAYLSVALLIMAVALSFVAVGQSNAARAEESSGQLENLLVRPYSRLAWLVERTAQGVVVLVIGGVLAGVATWTGAVSDGAHVRFSTLLDAGLNVAVPAVLLLGAGVVALAVVPRIVSVVTYGLFAFFFLIEILGSAVNLSHWILDLSAFHQMAASPAAPVNWTANAVMIALALFMAVLGLMVFQRRDLKGQ
ncbi:MAG: hypothetical protein ACLPKZ_09050 [Acidimicrobiales bacterium]